MRSAPAERGAIPELPKRMTGLLWFGQVRSVIRAEGAIGERAFVVRLQEPGAALTAGPWDTVLAGIDRGTAVYESRWGCFGCRASRRLTSRAT